jgi:hypothetical protein
LTFWSKLYNPIFGSVSNSEIIEVESISYIKHLEEEVVYLRTQNSALLDKLGSQPLAGVGPVIEDHDEPEDIKPIRGIESVTQVKKRLEMADLAEHLKRKRESNERIQG